MSPLSVLQKAARAYGRAPVVKTIRHTANTLEDVVRGIGKLMMREAFDGADPFMAKALADRLAELDAGAVPSWRKRGGS